MYARVARFEGLDTSRIDADIAEMKQQMDAGRSGELPDGAPDEARVIGDDGMVHSFGESP